MSIIKKAVYIFYFVCGVMLIALGVCLSTKGSLGTSPITAIPWTLSLCLPMFSFGTWVIGFNLLMIICEWILLRKSLSIYSVIIQVIITFFFGYCIEFWMNMLSWLNPLNYWQQICFVIAGCLFIAIGVCLNVISNVSVMPGDGFSIAIATVSKRQFARIRLLSDITMSAVALAMCLAVLGNMSGVREGTAIAAIATSCFVMILLKSITKIQRIKRYHRLRSLRHQEAHSK